MQAHSFFVKLERLTRLPACASPLLGFVEQPTAQPLVPTHIFTSAARRQRGRLCSLVLRFPNLVLIANRGSPGSLKPKRMCGVPQSTEAAKGGPPVLCRRNRRGARHRSTWKCSDLSRCTKGVFRVVNSTRRARGRTRPRAQIPLDRLHSSNRGGQQSH